MPHLVPLVAVVDHMDLVLLPMAVVVSVVMVLLVILVHMAQMEQMVQDLEAVAERYRGAGRREKGRILDELCATTGWHRKHAVRALRSKEQPASEPLGHGAIPSLHLGDLRERRPGVGGARGAERLEAFHEIGCLIARAGDEDPLAEERPGDHRFS